MEKTIKEEEIRELEDEIDSAVDRLFIDKKGGGPEDQLGGSPLSEPRLEKEKGLEAEDSFDLSAALTAPPAEDSFDLSAALTAPPAMDKEFKAEAPLTPPAAPPLSAPPMNSIDEMEAHLLSLEWEITGEKVQKAREEVLAARGLLGERTVVGSVLNSMAEVLTYMKGNEDQIQPALIKFLLDAKETVKLLLREDRESDIQIYKQLAYAGIESRFSCLEEMKKPGSEPSSLAEIEIGGESRAPAAGSDKIEEMLKSMNLFTAKAEQVLDKIDQKLSSLERVSQEAVGRHPEAAPSAMDVTIFEIAGDLFAVESEKVCKLFRPPKDFQDKYSNLQNVRLKEFEVRMIDLSELLSSQKGQRKGEMRILVVKDSEEYKGLRIGQVLKRLSTPPEFGEEGGGHFEGRIHWTYQDRSVDIPILDLKTF